MNKKSIKVKALLISFMSIGSLGLAQNPAIWEKRMIGINEPQIKALTFSPSNNSMLYVATDNALYRSDIKSQSVKQIFLTRNNSILNIYPSMQYTSTVYLATADGLYKSSDNASHWERIYFASDPLSRRCLSILEENNILYLGTARGAYFKTVDDKKWQKLTELPPYDPVYFIRQDAQNIYFATDKEVISLDKTTQEFDAIFVEHSLAQPETSDEISEEEFQDNLKAYIKYLQVTRQFADQIYVVTQKGIHMSSNHGRAWVSIPADKLPLEDATSLIVLKEFAQQSQRDESSNFKSIGLILGTKRGAFFYADGRWTPAYNGMETSRVNDLNVDAHNTVYAATDRGLFYLALEQALPLLNLSDSENNRQLKIDFNHEPTIRDVHRWAIEYAEVNPDKIKRWRQSASKKALLPTLSTGLDRSATDMFHWDTGPNPDNLLKGRDFLSWDVRLSWNLGELIWNNDQTSIDSRSKLMVELREDIMDQVTRIYFERRRLQFELNNPDSADSNLRLYHQMRVEELTALLDAFTGGEFSKKIKNTLNADVRESNANVRE